MPFMRRGHTSTSHHGMWRRSTSMGMDETARGTYAKDGTKAGPRGMALSAKIQTLAPVAPPCCVVGAGAVCGV